MKRKKKRSTSKKITVYLFTHPKHRKGGDTAKTYDGPLTEFDQGGVGMMTEDLIQTTLRKVQSGETPAFRGVMKRHLQTAELLGLSDKCVADPRCVNDVSMFALENGDKTVFTDWFAFLDEQLEKGIKEVFVITSRVSAYAMFYIMGGGQKHFGDFLGFLHACDSLAAMEGASLPLLAQGTLTTWEWDGETVTNIP